MAASSAPLDILIGQLLADAGWALARNTSFAESVYAQTNR